MLVLFCVSELKRLGGGEGNDGMDVSPSPFYGTNVNVRSKVFFFLKAFVKEL